MGGAGGGGRGREQGWRLFGRKHQASCGWLACVSAGLEDLPVTSCAPVAQSILLGGGGGGGWDGWLERLVLKSSMDTGQGIKF